MRKISYSYFVYRNLLLLIVLLLVGSCKNTPSAIEQPVADTWYRNAVIYNLDVKAFKDSDGNGVGDFVGLIQKLPLKNSRKSLPKDNGHSFCVITMKLI